MNLKARRAACGVLALCWAGPATSQPAPAQPRHWYICSVVVTAERMFVITSPFAAGPGEASRLRGAFARWLQTQYPRYRVDESAVDCVGDARMSTASYHLIRRKNENQLYSQTEVRFSP